MWLPGDLFEMKNHSRQSTELREFLRKQIDKHQSTFNENNIRDYIDAFLFEMKRHPYEKAGTDHFFDGI